MPTEKLLGERALVEQSDRFIGYALTQKAPMRADFKSALFLSSVK